MVSVGVLAAGLYALLLWIGTRGILRSYRRTPAVVEREFGFRHPRDLGLEAEELSVSVAPGLTLKGWLMRTGAPRRGVLVYHHGIWDAGAPRLRLAAHMVPRGFDAVFYDSRGHGVSGGRYCTYGVQESLDLIKVLAAVETLGVDVSRVAIVGHSMGGATAVYTATKDDRIKALVLEACYRDLPTAIRDYSRLIIPFLPEFIIRRAQERAGRIGGFDPGRLSPLNSMPHLKIPVLIVQGTMDRRIKPQYAREHFDAKPEPKDLHYIEGARHGRLWHEGGEPYMQVLEEWLCAHMPVETAADG
jgi:alpha-beta hydrolase superfamily lysophospholipase